MARQQELFAKAKRRSPRVMAKADDLGCLPNGQDAAHFVCVRCGWAAWLPCTTGDWRQGRPCPTCNEGVTHEAPRIWALPPKLGEV